MPLLKRITVVLLSLILLLPLGVPAQAAESDTDRLIRDLINYYHHYQAEARKDYDLILEEIRKQDPALADTWENILDFWIYLNRDMEIQSHVLPDGLPEDDSLCIVVMGYYLMSDGGIRDQLRDRLEVTLASAEKYPNSYILVTGGGTASENKKATEAGQMAKWLIKKGISEDRIIIEDKARSTIENATYGCKLLYRDYPQIKSLAVITSDYHIWRSCLYMNTQASLDAYELGVAPMRVVANATCPIDPKASKDVETQVEGVGLLTGLEVLRMSKPALTKLESLAVSGTTAYDFGSELDLTVTARYSNGFAADVTQQAIISGYDFGQSGVQTITVTYEEEESTVTATIDVEIRPPLTVATLPPEEPTAVSVETEPDSVTVPEESPSPLVLPVVLLGILVCVLTVLIFFKKKQARKRRRPRPTIKLN